MAASPITKAKKLLEKEGYTVTKKRPDPRIGDVVRFRDDECTVLITFRQTDKTSVDDTWRFGGVEVAVGKYESLSTDPLWIDSEEWAKDDGQYEVIGHVDLDKFTKTY